MITRGTPTSGAVFSHDEKHRVLLWRVWDGQGVDVITPSAAGLALCIGLNPSTADEENLDPTVTRIANRCRSLGYLGLMMMNAYSFQATDPKDMKKAPIKNVWENDVELVKQSALAQTVVLAWGANIDPVRERYLRDALAPRTYWCFAKTKHGKPHHPLYLPKDKPLEQYDWPEGKR